MTRSVLFQIHWFLGITAGLVLAVMGVTGATISFENEIMQALSPGVVTVANPGKPALSPDALVAAASAQSGGLRVSTLSLSSDPGKAAEVFFDPPKGKKGRGDYGYIDPYTGRLLGHAKGEETFRFLRSLHRWMALPGDGNGIGRTITGIAALSLIYFALSGLYLRWPRKPLDWRAWFVLDLRMSGRNLYRALHAVIGGWVLVFYLLSALTGLWWSYDWYRQSVIYALTGKAAEQEHGEKDGKEPKGPPPVLAPAWASFLQASGGKYESLRITIPKGDKPVDIRALVPGARHDRMTDNYRIDAQSGEVVKADLYAKRKLGVVITTSVYELHRGAFFGLIGRIIMLITSLTMPLFFVTGLLLYFARRRKKRELKAVDAPVLANAGGSGETLVVYASQTGGAERLARQTAAAFDDAQLVALPQLDEAMLAKARRALLVVSTYGEGEAPDHARSFARKAMAAPAALGELDYAVLALGDREYPDFCAFGHQVDHWLHQGGARRLFDMIEVDGDDPDAQRQWQQQIASIGAHGELPDWQPASYDRWRLAERQLLNPGSAGGPAYHIVLEPLGDAARDWEAGDIAEVLPRHDPAVVSAWLAQAGLDGAALVEGRALADHLAASILPDAVAGRGAQEIVNTLRPLPHREYSIASIPADGSVHLLVRQASDENGKLGLGSGWLTAFAPLGGEIAMRLHANVNFRAPADPAPMVLIGNGTGLAGLRAHLRHRAAHGIGESWLMLGERNAAHDAFHEAELLAAVSAGSLTRLDRTWSRDAGDGRYVQALLADHAEELRAWVQRGASIYVCGSLKGMAPAVDAALRAALGDETVEAMMEEGRYKRDIY
ncbi:sulfite reductase flavoprotein subunit alpha [Novosphingobium terrae]|uniref:sulfite reductase flavoprotein subunit alpha n=1 Tax=Novosphingobium terrae TaxID=2726189 RepID=UPI001981ADC0|nr:sulfite reductase flavoprotein subunit alpha [Novosphingobium terrae]